jgi:hypothetical protein
MFKNKKILVKVLIVIPSVYLLQSQMMMNSSFSRSKIDNHKEKRIHDFERLRLVYEEQINRLTQQNEILTKEVAKQKEIVTQVEGSLSESLKIVELLQEKVIEFCLLSYK